ncbi:hypothetical protein [Paraburkholderia sp. GAS42]|jgi:hypothetical protein|uniref:hypothetical protein n=1 Tax=Paraburkholderia sp. GAS42 TaxID=3035135 RepID=UPI003D23EEDB
MRPGTIATMILVCACATSHAETIRILSGTYGENCGVRRGNATGDLALHCNNRDACDYVVDRSRIGEPAVGCQKNFLAEWSCGSAERHTAEVSPEAGAGSTLVLSCIPMTGAGH